MIQLLFNKDLLWESDWNGDEVGYDDVLVVGCYRLANTNVYLYIDMETYTILEAFEMVEDEG
jgi:hypothetical protein